jgi:hypothetical protein
MIDLRYLAYAINRIIGANEFLVYLNSNVYPDDIGDRNVVIMSAMRVPFGFSNDEINVESLTITLTFNLPCDIEGDNAVIRNNALIKIQNALLGHKKFTVQDPNSTYDLDTFFELQPPGNPYMDNGIITQQIVVSGKALCKNAECFAIVGNDVKTFIKEENGVYSELLKVSRVANLQIGLENNIPLSENKYIPEVRPISQVNTKTLTFIYNGAPIEKQFLQMAEGINVDIEKVYWYKAIYGTNNDAVTVETPIKIIGVSTEDSAGVFLQYTLTMQNIER